MIGWAAGVGTLIGALIGFELGIGNGFMLRSVALLAGIGLSSAVFSAIAAHIAWQFLKLGKRSMKIAVSSLVAVLSAYLVSGWMLSEIKAINPVALSLVFAITSGAVWSACRFSDNVL